MIQEKIRCPIVLDNDGTTWEAYDNRYWPAWYLIDARMASPCAIDEIGAVLADGSSSVNRLEYIHDCLRCIRG
jgi:hypothetical protein